MKLDILYEDEHYIIVNKPSGLLSIPDRHNAAIPSVTGLLRSMYPSIFIIHRLDKDTSGILCFAKDEETHRYTSQLFEHRQVKKNYIVSQNYFLYYLKYLKIFHTKNNY